MIEVSTPHKWEVFFYNGASTIASRAAGQKTQPDSGVNFIESATG